MAQKREIDYFLKTGLKQKIQFYNMVQYIITKNS